MKIDKYMKRNVISIQSDRAVADAVAIFIKHPIGTLPVIDDKTRLVGILHLGDIVHMAMPDSFDLVGDLDFLHDLGAIEKGFPSLEEMKKPVIEIMSEPISAEIDFTLFHAAALLDKHHIPDLPVVDHQGR